MIFMSFLPGLIWGDHNLAVVPEHGLGDYLLALTGVALFSTGFLL